MSKYDEVVAEVIDSISNINCGEDKEKKIIKANLLLNVYNFIGDEAEYYLSVEALKKSKDKRKKGFMLELKK